KGCFLLLMLTFSAWNIRENSFDANYIQRCLQRCYNTSTEAVKLKKWEFHLTGEGFFRMRKYFPNGKQEYFAFNLKRIQEMNFLGTEEEGILQLQTKGEDIIVQT